MRKHQKLMVKRHPLHLYYIISIYSFHCLFYVYLKYIKLCPKTFMKRYPLHLYYIISIYYFHYLFYVYLKFIKLCPKTFILHVFKAYRSQILFF